MLRSRPSGRRLETRSPLVWASLCSAVLAVAAPARADDRGVVEACNKAGALPRPASDSAGAAPKGCDPLSLYDGVGGKPDHRAARACALSGGEDDFIGRAAVLSMIFANGDGVARDDDLAIAYACDAGGAPAEISGRVGHLLERKAKGAEAGKIRFDFCDDITSGMMQSACTGRASRVKGAERDAEIARLTARFNSKAKAGYASLRKAFEAYRTAVADNEVDISGTARGALITEAQDDEETAFLETLRAVFSAAPPPAGASLTDADAALNAAYRKVQALDDQGLWGTVTKDGIKTAQRAWLPYRDAFLAFAKAAGSKTSADWLAARLTERRTQNLGALLGNDSR